MRRARVSFPVAVLASLALGSCSVSCSLGDDADDPVLDDLDVHGLVERAAPASTRAGGFHSGAAKGVTRVEGHPFLHDVYDAELVVVAEERAEFADRLGDELRAALEQRGLRIEGRARGENRRSFHYEKGKRRGSVDLLSTLDEAGTARVWIVVHETPVPPGS